MRKIGTKIILSIFGVTLVSSLVITVISTTYLWKSSNEYAKEKMILQNESKTNEINSIISNIELSVNCLNDIAVDNLKDLNSFKTDENYVNDYVSRLKQSFLQIANNTKGAMTYYIRFNPDYTNPTSGIFASKSSVEGEFESLVPTDFSIYDKNDLEHVGWYYIPVNNGKETWMNPYYNENIDIYMISYVIPINIDGEIIGIVGMDINFDFIKDYVEDVKLYDSGYGVLVSSDNKVIYHPDTTEIFDLSEMVEEELVNKISSNENSKDVSSYTYKKIKRKLVYSKLDNGMSLIVTVPESEISNVSKIQAIKVAMIGILFAILSIIIAIILGKYISKPIRKITLIINNASQLDFSYNKELEKLIKGKDEIGHLSRAYNKLREELARIINDILLQVSKLNESSVILSDGADNISIESKKVEKNVNNIFSRVQESSASSEELVATIQEIKSSIDILYSKASNSSDNAILSKKKAEEVQEEGKKSKDKTLDIYNSEKSKSEKVMKDAKVVQEIINMAEAIESISQQTNLLALNAAIESARAGDAGKGFAVVAEEVRTLAEQSQDSVKNIKDTIQKVEKAFNNLAHNNIEVLDFINNDIGELLNVIQQMGDDYNNDSETTNKLAQDLKSLSEELEISITQVSKVVEIAALSNQESAEYIDDIGNDLSKTVLHIEQVNNVAKNQKEIATYIDELIKRFKI